MSENLWSFDAVEVGQRGFETTVTLTAADIAEYAALAHADTDSDVAMATMLLSSAPLLRETIAEANGFVAYEQSEHARRQTPFTKCTLVSRAVVRPGDTIRGTREVLEKFEKRGSRFVTFRITAYKRQDVVVGHYDYTCVFDLARAKAAKSNPAQPREPMAPNLGELVITETQESMNRKDAFRLIGPRGVGSNIHTDTAFARASIFEATVNSGPATMSYVDALLKRNVPRREIAEGLSLTLRAITPWRVGETVRLTGRREQTEFTVQGLNQKDELVCAATASLR